MMARSFRAKVLVVILISFGITTAADAQKIYFSSTAQTAPVGPFGTKQPLGVEVAYDTWSDSDPDYADKTYQAFKAYKLSQKSALGAYDYYYRLKLTVPSKFTSTNPDCRSSPFLQALVNGAFGFNTAGLILINANISYEPAIGAVTPLITNKSPLLMFSQGAAANVLTPGSGCFLKASGGIDFPVIRFENGDTAAGKEVFEVNFDIQAGSALKSNFVQNALNLFSNANTAFRWNAIAGGATALLTAGATDFDNALNAAGSFQFESPVNITLRQKSKIYLRIPTGYSNQHLFELFPYVSASILLSQGMDLTPATVLSNIDLAVKTCALTAIVAGTCTANNARISILTGADIKEVTPANYQFPLSLFDPLGKPDLVRTVCDALRIQLNDMRLSTVDQMLVRWAFTKESKLQDALNDATQSNAIVAATKPAVTLQQIKTSCWNDGDNAVLNAITAALHVQLKS